MSINSFAQSDTITAATAKNYIGKEVVLKGVLKGFKPYSDRNGKNILFLDIDESYPNSEIGVTVFPDAVPEVKITKDASPRFEKIQAGSKSSKHSLKTF